jgi:hypothetical protein
LTDDNPMAEHQVEEAALWAFRAARAAQRAIWARRADGLAGEPDLETAQTMALVSIAQSLARLAEKVDLPETADETRLNA